MVMEIERGRIEQGTNRPRTLQLGGATSAQPLVARDLPRVPSQSLAPVAAESELRSVHKHRRPIPPIRPFA